MNTQPVVYLNYAAEDRARVADVYTRLAAAGFRPWWDADILPGENWRSATNAALESADFFLAIFTRNRGQRSGFFAQELEQAMEKQARRNRGDVFVIPVRLEPCEVPEELRHIVWVDLDTEDGWPRLLKALGQVASEPLPAPEPPTALTEACQKGNCVLYAGAGLSAAAGFPTWNRFVPFLLEWAGSAGAISPRSRDSLQKALVEGDLNLAADSIVSEIDKRDQLPRLHGFLQETFDRDVPLTRRHELIRALEFSAVLTTNFDTLLEHTFPGAAVLTPWDIENLLEQSGKRQFFIAKLYGSLDRPDSLLVSPAQYKDAIIDNRRFAEFIESIFVSHTLLFLGASLDGISAYLEGIRFRGGEQRHYALVAVSSSAWEAKAEMLRRRYGIEVLPYTESEQHHEVDEFLASLLHRVRPPEEVQAGREPRAEFDRRGRAQLTRILLENVGPFAALELELTPNWNILLGDNGVGKTTILRSIALAMCGRDAQAYARRVVRSGQPKARIVLETDQGRKYVTEVFQTSSGFEVESFPRRPLDTEGWLVLGFPPIRSATWRKCSGPQGEPTRSRSTIDDLLPLLSGEPDPRLDEVKQWIINLDYWKSKGDSAGQHPPSYYEDLRQGLFAVIKRLTEGMKIEFERVDPTSWEVLVKTDDGIVPMDAVSQGTASVMGWTGILVQRLFALFDGDVDPLKQYAIVILDEIDAHMHPVWQQSLISALSELFPHVQFIATTHSPLIVGGMQKEQVVRLVRNETGAVEKLEIPADMLMGRTDQILTGDLFGLDTTLDKKTLGLMDEYHALLGKQSIEPTQEQRLRELREELRFRIPVSQETPVERRAHEVIRLLLKQQIGETYPEIQQELLEKADQLLMAVKGKGRAV